MVKSSSLLTLNSQFQVRAERKKKKKGGKERKEGESEIQEKPSLESAGKELLQEGACSVQVLPASLSSRSHHPLSHMGFLEDVTNKVTVLTSQGFRLASKSKG